MDTEELLDFCCEIGRQMTVNGAEIYRVEESLERILSAYNYPDSEVFAIPSCIILTVHRNGHGCTRSARVHALSQNLDRLNRLNDLCRFVCREVPPLAEARGRMEQICTSPPYPAWISFLAYGLGASCFTLFWGGTLRDALIAFFCGLLVRLTVTRLRRLASNVFFLNVITSMLLAAVPLLLATAGLPNNTNKVIVGTIMLLVPGIAITNAMRDVLAGDFLTALIRLAEVLIVAVAIATGIALAIGTQRLIFGGG